MNILLQNKLRIVKVRLFFGILQSNHMKHSSWIVIVVKSYVELIVSLA